MARIHRLRTRLKLRSRASSRDGISLSLLLIAPIVLGACLPPAARTGSRVSSCSSAGPTARKKQCLLYDRAGRGLKVLPLIHLPRPDLRLVVAWDYKCPRTIGSTHIAIALDEYRGNPNKGGRHTRNEIIVLAFARTYSAQGRRVVDLPAKVNYIWPTVSVNSLLGAVATSCSWRVRAGERLRSP